jgi:hypothetical protein
LAPAHPCTAADILESLATLFPDFAAAWNSPENCFLEDDGTFTLCGVFAEFSHYFRDQYEQISPTQIAEVGRLVTECVASSDQDLSSAATLCFLENVAAERFSPAFRRHLNGEALRFYSLWDKG